MPGTTHRGPTIVWPGSSAWIAGLRRAAAQGWGLRLLPSTRARPLLVQLRSHGSDRARALPDYDPHGLPPARQRGPRRRAAAALRTAAAAGGLRLKVSSWVGGEKNVVPVAMHDYRREWVAEYIDSSAGISSSLHRERRSGASYQINERICSLAGSARCYGYSAEFG